MLNGCSKGETSREMVVGRSSGDKKVVKIVAQTQEKSTGPQNEA